MNSNGSFTNENLARAKLLRNENVRADGDEVFVWRRVGLLLVHFRGRLVYCVVIRAEVAQFALTSRTNSLSAAVVRKYTRSVTFISLR